MLNFLLTFIKISATNFGGGYALTALIKGEIVDRLHLLTVRQYADILATTQVIPGPLALTSTTLVGFMTKGVPGVLLVATGLVLPSLVFVLIMMRAMNYFRGPSAQAVFKGIRFAGLALLFFSGVILGREALLNSKAVLIAVFSYLAIYRFKLHPLIVLACAGLMGFL